MYKIPSQHLLLQDKRAQISQPFLTKEMLQSPNHLCNPPLDFLQEFHVSLLLGTPELDIVSVQKVSSSLDTSPVVFPTKKKLIRYNIATYKKGKKFNILETLYFWCTLLYPY